MNQPIPIELLDMNDILGESVIKEIVDRKKEKTKHHGEDFQALFIKKNQGRYQKSTYKKEVVQLLIESFGKLLSITNFYHG